MHSHCFGQYTRYHYTCPICAKSLGDMSVYFRMIDSMVAHDRTSLPPTVRDRIQVRPRSRNPKTLDINPKSILAHDRTSLLPTVRDRIHVRLGFMV